MQFKDGDLDAIERDAEKGVGSAIRVLAGCPGLSPAESYIWAAYCDLSGMRDGTGRIRISDVQSWMDLHGLDVDIDRQFLYAALAAVDVEWCKLTAKELEAERARINRKH